VSERQTWPFAEVARIVIVFVPNSSGISAVHAVVPFACPDNPADDIQLIAVAPVDCPRTTIDAPEAATTLMAGEVMRRVRGCAGSGD
jgi:hypothetical protein